MSYTAQRRVKRAMQEICLEPEPETEPDTQLEMADGVPIDLREKWPMPQEKE